MVANEASGAGLAGPDTQEVSVAELVRLCALDTELFGKVFFPKAFRDPAPAFAGRVWNAMEDPRHRFVLEEMFRGSSKTTRCRVFAAKRIAYGLSRTILYVGASESHATRSVQWLRAAIEPRMGAGGAQVPSLFAQTFALRPGRKWQEHEIEVFHGLDERPIWVLGVGITGNIRGINFDDYRPDLIILDDVITDENASTEEQREKVIDLILGALANSLAPASEEPNAKIVFLQTPLDARDAAAQAKASSEWHTISVGCWTEETKDFPIEQQESTWPARYPSESLRAQKRAALRMNRLSIFAREMECSIVPAESLAFRPTWLRFYETVPRGTQNVLVIDPVPPPSDKELAKGLKKKDYEAISVVGRKQGDFYVLESIFNRGHDPNWTIAKMFELGLRWHVTRIVVETVAYQRVLKWLIEQEMKRRQIYFAIKEAPIVGQGKYIRIIEPLTGVASQGHLWCSAEHVTFITQFESYGIGYRGHEDVLESIAVGVAELTNPFLELGAGDYVEVEGGQQEDFEFQGACP